MSDVLAVCGTVATGLMAGTMFSYGIAVLPGLRTLGSREFVTAFTAMDLALERGVFLVPVFLGAPILAAISAALAWGSGAAWWYGASAVSLLLTATITITVHRPLNGRVRRGAADPRAARAGFRERLWVAWHVPRVVLTALATGAMGGGLLAAV